MSARLTALNVAYRQALIDRRPAVARVHRITTAAGQTFSGFYWLMDPEGRRHLARCGPNVEQAFVDAGQGAVDAYKAVLACKHAIRAEIKAELVRVALELCTREELITMTLELVAWDVWDNDQTIHRAKQFVAAERFTALLLQRVEPASPKQPAQVRGRFARFLWEYFQTLRGQGGRYGVNRFTGMPSALTAELAPAADEPIGRLPDDSEAGGPCGGAVGVLRAVRDARSPAMVTLQLDAEETTR